VDHLRRLTPRHTLLRKRPFVTWKSGQNRTQIVISGRQASTSANILELELSLARVMPTARVRLLTTRLRALKHVNDSDKPIENCMSMSAMHQRSQRVPPQVG
jgi:hypothetical protein